MPISRAKKSEIVRDLKEKIDKAKSLAFARFHGLSVAKASALRRLVRQNEGEYVVAKKTLMGVAFRNAGKEMPETLEGEVGVIFGYGDEIAPFKAASDFAKKEKDKDVFVLVGGFFENAFVDGDTARRIGSIPSREVLIAQLMGVINGNTRKLVYILDQMSKKSV